MGTRHVLVALLSLAAACASAGTPPATEATVPVFDSRDDVPCQFEVMRTIRGESNATTGGSPAAFEQERGRVLGRVGARAGADAVLVEAVGEMAGVQRRVAAPAGSLPNLQFVGEALRYLPGTCSVSR